MKMTKRAKNRKGFTLLEVLIALTIFTIGLLAAAGMQGIAINANSVANRLSVAASLAQQVAEDLLSQPSTLNTATAALPPGVTYDLDLNSAATYIDIPGAGRYTAAYSITPNAVVNGAAQTGTTEIQVQVSYTSKNGSTKAVTYTTYKRVI